MAPGVPGQQRRYSLAARHRRDSGPLFQEIAPGRSESQSRPPITGAVGDELIPAILLPSLSVLLEATLLVFPKPAAVIPGPATIAKSCCRRLPYSWARPSAFSFTNLSSYRRLAYGRPPLGEYISNAACRAAACGGTLTPSNRIFLALMSRP